MADFAFFMLLLGVVIGALGCSLMIYNLYKAYQGRLDNRAAFIALIPIGILFFIGTSLMGSTIFDTGSMESANQRSAFNSLFGIFICPSGFTALVVVTFLFSVWQTRLSIRVKSNRQKPFP